MHDNMPPDSTFSLYSHGKKRPDTSIYTGTSGNILLYFRLYELYTREGREEQALKARADAEQALKTNLAVLKQC